MALHLSFPSFEPGRALILIAGPCALEDSELNLGVASHLADLSKRLDTPIVFKASYDKANRSSIESPRGPGIERGLELLGEVREATGLPVLTDVHGPEQVELAAAVVDALQVPAFLSRQTDLLVAAGSSGLPVNVKKGQWMAPEHIAHSVEKVRSAGATQVSVTERGTAFGYGRWVVDMRSFAVMRETSDCPALFDGTHAVQLPGGAGARSGGEPRFIAPLCLAAVAAGADGLYLEVHPAPESAPSDSSTMLRLERLESLLTQALEIRRIAGQGASGGE